MPSMTAMEATVKILENEGIEVIFGIPGAGILPFYDALRHSKKIKHYLARHEEGAIHAADGYARTTRKVGVCVGTSGPAGTNFVTGLYTAQVDSIPIIAITGQHVRSQLGKEAFQAVDISEIVKPITKKSYCVKESGQIPFVFREAFKIAREGRPGPVLIDLPLDVQNEKIVYEPNLDTSLRIEKPFHHPEAIKTALKMILEAERPLILLGGGVIIADATKELLELADYLEIPVVTSLMGKGGIPDNHPLYAGQIGVICNTTLGNKVFLESDLVLGIGCRFSDRHTGTLEVYRKGRKFIHIDIEPTQIGRIFPPELGIVSDAKLALEVLLQEAKSLIPKRKEPFSWVKNIQVRKDKTSPKLDYDQIPIKPQRVFKEINEFFNEDTIFVTCIGLNQIWSSQFQKIFKPQHYLVPGGAGPLGWDLPAAIGAKIAKPDHLVVQVTGDYGLGFCLEELGMAAMYNIPILIIVINNGYLSLIRQAEKYLYGIEKPYFEVATWYEDAKVDFSHLDKVYGIYTKRITKPEEIQPAFRHALESGKPAIVDIIVEQDADASMGTSLNNIVIREE